MIYKIAEEVGDRKYHPEVLNYITTNKFKRVIDVGGSQRPWGEHSVSHYFDLIDPSDYYRFYFKTEEVPDFLQKSIYIEGSFDNPYSWSEIWKEIISNGKFDFVICTQTLEHCLNPFVALEFLRTVGKEGYITVPHKQVELSRPVGKFRGFMPHRWIIDIKDEKMRFFPKLNFLEYSEEVDNYLKNNEFKDELSFWWKDKIEHWIFDDTLMDFPQAPVSIENYERHLFK